MNPNLNFQGNFMKTYLKLTNVLRDAAKQVRNRSENENQDLWTAYCIVGNIINTLVEFGTKKTGDVSESCLHRITLSANMVQSFNIVENLITSGAYWSASALLRQHMETLSRIIEYRKGKKRVDMKQSNSRKFPFNMAPNYDRLSELCHTSGSVVLKDFSEYEVGEGTATIIPKYQKEWAKNFFSLHIAHMISLALEIWFLQDELYPNDELPNIDDDLLKVSDLLVETGFWEEIKGES
jgi:Arc/MetJ-type ribon-helix-helix transcriptional regulator